MSIICLDTSIVIWAVQKQSNDPQTQSYINHTAQFVGWLSKQKADVIVPSIVVGELLVPIPFQDHVNVLAQLSSEWMVVDFDLQAARLFAEMRYDRAIVQIMEETRAGNPYATRKQLIADVMIIATARAHGAEKIYSPNKDFLKLAHGYIAAENFLDMSFQMGLPEGDQ